MAEKSRRRSLPRFIGPVVAIVVALVGCLAAVVTMTLEALEEREGAVAAADLRLAVMTVAPVTDASELEPSARARFTTSLETLALDLEPALHAVTPSEAASAQRQIRDLRASGLRALDGRAVTAGSDRLTRYQPLLDTLRDASLNAATDAKTAEQSAGAAALGSVVLLGLVMGLLLRAKTRARSIELRADVYRSAADRFGALLEQIPTATAVVAEDDSVSYSSASMTALLETPPQTVADLDVLASPSEQEHLRHHLKNPGADRATLDVQSQLCCDDSGVDREFRVRVTDMTDDSLVKGHLVSVSEMTAENRSRRQLEYLAGHDKLTGLPNRRSMMAAIAADEPVSLLMIDLDGFKQTNDALGHGAGDELLVAVTGRFQKQLGHGSTMYRLGGDEFAIMTDVELDEARQLAERLLTTLEEPIKLKVGFERAAASIGIARHDPVNSRLSLLRRADIALYDAKHGGGGRIRLLDADLEASAVVGADLSRSLETASFDQEFHLAFQPIVDAQTHRAELIEALARWISPAHGFVPPDQFIPMAESSGRIKELGEWVLDQALATLAQLRSEGKALETRMSVNVSPYQLMDGSFSEHVSRLLGAHGLQPSDLVLELTESALVTHDSRTISQLSELRSLGCAVACDDFGSGYSNLGQLMRLPLSLIKVDRQLLIALSEMREQASGSADQPCQVMTAIASIGEAMMAKIVAEGVETEMQASSLRDSGIQLLQGYYFSRPVDAETLLNSDAFEGAVVPAG